MGKTLGFLVVALCALAFTATATAGNPSLCRDWQHAQSATGGSFTSRIECARARDVYLPNLVSSESAVVVGQTFILNGSGFHESAGALLEIAVTGQPPYFSTDGLTNTDGTFIGIITFQGICTPGSYPLTFTVTDSFGVHASTEVTLNCS